MNTSVLPRKKSGFKMCWVSDVMRGTLETDKHIIPYHHFDKIHRRKNDKYKREINQYSDPPGLVKSRSEDIILSEINVKTFTAFLPR